MENVKEKRNRGGRPKIEVDEALDHRLVTRLNSKEYKEFETEYENWRIGRAGKISDFLREIINNRKSTRNINKVFQKEETIELTQTLYSIRQELKRIEYNYNQITKRINSIEHIGKLYYEVQESKLLINQIEPLVNQIDRLLKEQTEAYYKQE
ncbi:hypothetical protein GO730_38585 [Spirosoma sp. HMF3257]|uniref:Uncharacterized protein n=1 Tax=Spirosoma telluris TaxID=2183553 RepID=A0A327NCN7_9BACT|nr:hypothetical protein [Spirosoma telluris]RAI73011.1 hypothetical protein HMF3257_38500 [Spirosoma telluris]